jgi:hypothetical protein
MAESPPLTSWVEDAQGSEFPIQNLPWGVFVRDDDASQRQRAGRPLRSPHTSYSSLRCCYFFLFFLLSVVCPPHTRTYVVSVLLSQHPPPPRALARQPYPTVGAAIGSWVLDVTWLAEFSDIFGYTLLLGCEGLPPMPDNMKDYNAGDDEGYGCISGVGGSSTRCFSQGSLKPFMTLGPIAWRSVRLRLQTLLAAESAGLGHSPLRGAPAAKRRGDFLIPRAAVTMRLPCDIGDYTDFYSSMEHAYNVGCMFRGGAVQVESRILRIQET